MAIPLHRLSSIDMLIEESFLRRQLLDSIQNRDIFNTPIHPDQIYTSPMSMTSEGFTLTNDLSSPHGKEEIVFYHPIQGLIFAYPEWEYVWGKGYREMFSTLQFIDNLRLAESSENVIAHFLHINSGGGQAWAIDLAAAEMLKCKKPIYAFIEGMCGSAAYYLASASQVIKSFTKNDFIGSIGAMFQTVDFSCMLEKQGIREVTQYATRSDLKNKVIDDLIGGEGAEYTRRFIDPLQSQFETHVRVTRPMLTDVDDMHPALRGEIYHATEALEVGLVDGIISDLSAAMREAYELGKTIKLSNSILT